MTAGDKYIRLSASVMGRSQVQTVRTRRFFHSGTPLGDIWVRSISQLLSCKDEKILQISACASLFLWGKGTKCASYKKCALLRAENFWKCISAHLISHCWWHWGYFFCRCSKRSRFWRGPRWDGDCQGHRDVLYVWAPPCAFLRQGNAPQFALVRPLRRD